jgi:hypothetical protein
MTEGNNYILTIANIADIVGNVMATYPLSFTYGISSQYWVGTIADLRAKFTSLHPVYETNVMNVNVDTVYKLTGNAIITAINDSYRHQIYIQDATGAIVLDDVTNLISGVDEGDEITAIYGRLTGYYGHLQFVVIQNVVPTGAIFQEVTPVEVTLAQLDDNNYMNDIQSQLITVRNVTFTATGNFANNNYYNLQQSGTTLDSAVWIHFWNIPTLTGAAIPTVAKDITGVNKTTRSSYRILPRSGADIATPLSIDDQTILLGTFIYPNPAQDKLTIETTKDIDNVAVLNLLGQKIRDYKMAGNRLDINLSDLNSGVYFIQLHGKSGMEVSKIIKN